MTDTFGSFIGFNVQYFDFVRTSNEKNLISFLISMRRTK